ncbi:MAG: NAD(P)H-dependent glycerol-3-phosphate dehydrogenase [Vicinamibacteria bacterium]
MKLSVLGAGSWGTALAQHAASCGHPVTLYAREPELARAIDRDHANPEFLPGVALARELRGTSDLGEAVAGAEALIVAIPSEFCRTFYRQLTPLAPATAPLVSATKGLELGSLRRMTEVAAEELPGRPLAALSGPSFALEVARGQPSAVVLASAHEDALAMLQRALSSRSFRVYGSSDLVGVELAGALKNVIAIAAGILAGLGYGHNTVAALITRGLAEMSRLALAKGGRAETLSGLAGLGDLVLTCTGALSRNRALGEALGRGQSLQEAQAGTRMVAEGVRTTAAACTLAEQAGVEMPIAHKMREVLYEGKAPRLALDELMLRSLKNE